MSVPINSIENNTIELDLNKILDRTYPDDKIGILDVRINVNNEMEIDLEMQMLYKEMLIERVLWYWAKLYSNQLKSGDDYSALKKTLEILIVNDTLPELKNILKPCTRWQIRECEIFSEVLTDKFEIVIIELPKVEQAYLKDTNNLLLQWMMFLLNPESLEVSKIMEKNENIKVATKELEEISEEQVNQIIAELREKARRDEVSTRLTCERIGREKAQKEYEERIEELKEKARRDEVAMRLTGERIGREKAQKEYEEKIEELKEKARRDEVATRLTGERIGREKAQKEYEEKIEELKEKMMTEKSTLVKNLMNINLTLSQISEITGLSVEEITNITN